MSLPARVGVIGGGRMGSGIAHAFLLAGCEVCIIEQNEAAACAAGRPVARGELGRKTGQGSYTW